MSSPEHPHDTVHHDAPSSSSALRLIAAVVFFTAVYFLSSVLLPFLFALVIAIALAPVASYLQRLGLGRTISSLICMLLVAAFIVGTFSLISYQAGTMLQKGDQYVDRLGMLSARAIRFVGGDRLLETVVEDPAAKPSAQPKNADSSSQFNAKDTGDALVAQARDALRRDAREIGRWAASGVGGVLGGLASVVIFLAFLFYLLDGRDHWIDRLKRAGSALEMRPRSHEFRRVAGQLRSYLGALAMVSVCYAVVMTFVLWMIGVPQPLLWGVVTALLEVIPFFGPVVATILPTVAALGAGDGVWQPVAVVCAYVVLQTIEGYVVTPLLYGKAVDIDPVTVLLGVMFFGFLLGPFGLALAMPMMILMRGVLILAPDSPALSALADADEPSSK